MKPKINCTQRAGSRHCGVSWYGDLVWANEHENEKQRYELLSPAHAAAGGALGDILWKQLLLISQSFFHLLFTVNVIVILFQNWRLKSHVIPLVWKMKHFYTMSLIVKVLHWSLKKIKSRRHCSLLKKTLLSIPIG